MQGRRGSTFDWSKSNLNEPLERLIEQFRGWRLIIYLINNVVIKVKEIIKINYLYHEGDNSTLDTISLSKTLRYSKI